ncbi:DUF4932 domain-containing protein [Spirosoma sp. HMF4905]|uniref:DUF4932 domain-containing protein n=1 Tax=Spirosoma arboris TaxID=2682092 RepID=A0A7K1SJ16_9BACT|nr:DUF4932 domain-containing protein [Spirosoma arboris]MVM33807.1 DUF4932 domain-containing protein [Spirosoma arboris]
MTKLSAVLLVLILAASCLIGKAETRDHQLIRLSETYELANIILALTDYGKSDPWEVSQQSAYYQEVRLHFDQYASHPLLAKVNYSREKWESYLSFRTDAYAFDFNKDSHLVRTLAFTANRGFNPFEENLELVDDFVKVTGFRQFYKDHLPYYQRLATDYLASQRYPEMLQFLEKELGKRQEITSYAIVLSPLVGRMNCHRMVGDVGTDFITLPNFLLTGKAVRTVSQEAIASGTHMLFTELDHAFVNPLTDQYRTLLKANFSNQKWDTGSGYEQDSLATFNEYMTWAVYDLYTQTYFPDVTAKVNTDWALQNETRGFYASSLFNRELATLYHYRKPGQTLKDLYPIFIKQIGLRQPDLSKPLITDCNLANKTIEDTLATFVIHFSEPMKELSSFDVIRAVSEQGKLKQERLEITRQNNGLDWSDNGRTVRFTLNLVKGTLNQLIFNYPWKTLVTLRSFKGVDLPPYSFIKTTVSAGD